MDGRGITKLQPGSAAESFWLRGTRSCRFTLAMTARRLSQHSSIPLDDKNCLIVDTIFLANPSETIISFESVFEQCIAHVFCRLQVVLAHDDFKLLSFLLAASVINPIGVKKEDP